MLNQIPISDASFSEVMVRVSFRCIHHFRSWVEQDNREPEVIMADVAAFLSAEGFSALACHVRGYLHHYSPIFSTIHIRELFIWRSRQGYSWRRVVYPAYKKARRDPRVTNRGVARSPRSEED